MTVEPMHTASKERRSPESFFLFFCLNACSSYQILLESTVAIMLCFQLCSAHYTVLQMKAIEEAPLQSIQSPQNLMICALQLSITASKLQWPLCFTFSYVHPVT